MREEIESLHKNHTFKFVEKPKHQKFVGCKWLFMKKEEIHGVQDARHNA